MFKEFPFIENRNFQKPSNSEKSESERRDHRMELPYGIPYCTYGIREFHGLKEQKFLRDSNNRNTTVSRTIDRSNRDNPRQSAAIRDNPRQSATIIPT